MSDKSSFPVWAIGLIATLALVVGMQSWWLYQLSSETDRTAKVAAQPDESIPQPLPRMAKAAPQTPLPATSTSAPAQITVNDPFLNQRTPLNAGAWDPIAEMQRMREQMDRMFAQSLQGINQRSAISQMKRSSFAASPRIDVKENPDGYEVIIDLPGAENSQIDTRLDGQTLTISASIDNETDTTDNAGNVVSRARHVSKFVRSIPFNDPVDDQSLTTNYQDGVLHINIAKA